MTTDGTFPTPQLALVTRRGLKGYALIGHYWTATGLGEIPQVDCPVVDWTDVTDRSKMVQVMHEYAGTPLGVTDVEAVLEKLAALGCTVERQEYAHAQ